MSLVMGIDSSTQSIKAVIIDVNSREIICSEAVNFAQELGAKYNSPEAVIQHNNPLVKHSNPLMWLEGLDILLLRLKEKSVPLNKIKAISGCGQQHGSVYLNANFEKKISSLDTNKQLHENIAPLLSRKTSPIWMDSSTSAQCKILSEKIGKEKIRQKTGSAPTERFTGPQIMKFYQEEPENYEKTKIIHLVSSFMASVFAGKSAPIDYGDGAGMNMMDLETLDWDEKICNTIAPGLKSKLPSLVKTTTVLGYINPYFYKYNFSPDTKIVAWTGDNPASLVGTGAALASTAVISLGTSDTFFSSMQKPYTDPDGCGHVFGNPVEGYMSLICFKNGSLAREKIKNDFNVDWDYFGNDAFRNTIPGSGSDNLLLPHFVPEITPLRLNPIVKYSGSEDFILGKTNKDVVIRAIVESQILAMRLHSLWIGQNFKTIKITGGGSRSPGICQTVADIFSADVESIAIPDSAALGSALIAAAATGIESFPNLILTFTKPIKIFKANLNNKAIYDRMLEKYKILENS
ncbi:MAG TPA: FGGY family carbohydrate kinase [Victivallales bacterium]|nr:FGGY family carbohydrate kinase [Victivallales bacterium]HPO90550.1 FGGY family carbohydrate kinase [Victivallales bacterium]HRR05944.1 FGGY family carbohydrate kinase [Victivallales bacterium]HRR28535.1 FGGY family carbohydrate kinase [Victivallales bacterium]